MKQRFISIILALCLTVSMACVGIVPAAADTAESTYETYAQSTVDGSAILHCFDWSYNNIKAALPDIAKAGYTAVQTSPVQAPKDYNASWTDAANQWWKLYQPLGFSVANGNTWLGTKAELTALCTEAEKYGVKVIVDIVANHVANNGTDGGTYSYVNSAVESQLKNSAYYHTNNTRTNDNSRYNITQYHLGMPDLNTANSTVQGRVINLLEECIDCGVDGFRFDAAKHIELPTDPNNCKSDFWPNVLNTATSYATNKGLATPFYYGEILGSAGTDIGNYTTYMAVTDNTTGDRALDKAYWSAASELANGAYDKGASASKSVLWVESHDTYMGSSGTAWVNNTQSVTSDVIIKAWAIVGARADSTALFFARPNTTMGRASSDTTWKDKSVAEVNKFKNHFEGTSEYLASSGNTAYIERGTKGVVISKLDGSGSVSLTAHTIQSGTYTDQVTGNTFTVSGGKITGTVGESGVAVVYNANDDLLSYITASTLYLKPSAKWLQDGGRYAMYFFNSTPDTNAWVSMTDTDGDGTYSGAVPAGKWTNVIFCRMDGTKPENNWDNRKEQTSDLVPDPDTDCYTVSADKWSVYSATSTEPTSATETTAPTTQPTDAPSGDTITVYAINDASWSSVKIHYWGGSSSTSWPGNDMTSYSGTKVFKAEIPADTTGIVLNNGSGTQTVNIESGIADSTIWTINSTQSSGKNTVSVAPTYYLVGTMNNWTHKDDYTFTLKSSDSGKLEYKLSNVQLNANADFKVHSSSDTWYPSGTNWKVTYAGTYDIYFRPNGDGNSDWLIDSNNTSKKYVYLNKKEATYTVTWKNGDTVLETDTNVATGTTPSYDGATPVKESTDQATYTFSGWSPSVAPVTGDITYTAQFTEAVKTYTVTWKNYNGTVLETDENVPYGTTPSYDGATPARTSHGSDTYVFSGWAPTIKQVTADVTYTARFVKNTKAYTITWLDGDGNRIKTETVLENVMPAYTGETPTKTATAQYTYTYNGTWTPGVVAATEDATYTANFDSTVNTYTVTWKNHDGATLKTDTVAYGATPTYTGETPTKASDQNGKYTFTGWDKDIAPVTGDVTYTARFTASAYAEYTVKATNVIDWDDVYLYYWTDFGDNSWPGTKMTADADNFIFSAQIPENAKGVIFNNGAASNTRQTVDIKDGIKDGAHWAILNEKDTTETTKYKVHAVHDYYLVGTMTDWKTDDAVQFVPHKASEKVEEYKIASASLKKDDAIKVYGKDNDTWYPDGYDNDYKITADGTYNIYFRPNADGGDDWHENVFYVNNVTPYTVTWKNADGTILETDENVLYGTTPKYDGATPTKAADAEHTYTFKGWDKEIVPITEDITYTATYTAADRNYFSGYSLTLKGEIGVNFFIDLCGRSADNAEVVLSWYKYSETVKLSDLTPESSGLYKVTCFVAAKEMSDEITATLTIDDETVATDTYSVAAYANRIIENEDGEFNDFAKLAQLQELSKAMLHYGAQAQLYFVHNTENLADSKITYTPESIDDSKLIIPALNDDNFSPFGLTYAGDSLLLKNTTTLRVFFTPDESYDGTEVYYGDQKLTAGTRGSMIYFDIKGIKAADILKDQTLTFKKSGAADKAIAFNISDYIAGQKSDPSLNPLLTGLYDYNRKAVAYLG